MVCEDTSGIDNEIAPNFEDVGFVELVLQDGILDVALLVFDDVDELDIVEGGESVGVL